MWLWVTQDQASQAFVKPEVRGGMSMASIALRVLCARQGTRFGEVPQLPHWEKAAPGKRHGHRWDVLTSTPQKFKGLIDKDWLRELLIGHCLRCAVFLVFSESRLLDFRTCPALELRRFMKALLKLSCLSYA